MLLFGRASRKDVDTLVSLCSTTFVETYEDKVTTPGLVRDYAQKTFTAEALEKDLVEELWIARHEDQAVGYLKVTKETGPGKANDLRLGHLKRLYLLKRFHGRGWGKELLAKAEAIAREKGHGGLWLSVMRANTAAICFYERNGYRVAGTVLWEYEYEGALHRDEDDVMLKFW